MQKNEKTARLPQVFSSQEQQLFGFMKQMIRRSNTEYPLEHSVNSTTDRHYLGSQQ